MSTSVSSLVVHIVALIFLYLLILSAVAHRLANITYPRHSPAFAAAVHTQSGTEHGLTHSHTHSITVVAGAVLSLVFLYPARALRHAVCASAVVAIASAVDSGVRLDAPECHTPKTTVKFNFRPALPSAEIKQLYNGPFAGEKRKLDPVAHQELGGGFEYFNGYP
ncbi:hypothetical protein C8R43DRAFT_1139843 [Mycena crocata]|nr:hypothetical protein C8R43DRAFT_1139843 [Mycena crocata]